MRTKAESLYAVPNAMLILRGINNFIDFYPITEYYSGPTTPSTGKIWYDTTTNLIKRNISGTWTSEQQSLPIGLVDVSDTDGFTSINQVFNGFGYIGSTVFALPGVKGLIPNGRNEDGTLKNTAFTLNKVITNTSGNYTYTEAIIAYKENSFVIKAKEDWYYNQYYNICLQNFMEFGRVDAVDGKLTSFQPKTTFHTLDWNNKATIGSWSMPSDRYIDLTLGTDGSDYTAPANGWYVIRKAASAAGQYWYFANESAGNLCYSITTHNNDQTVEAFIPAKSGDIIRVNYNLGGSTGFFRFIYAKGEN